MVIYELPDDEFVEVTSYGSREPEYLLGRTGAQIALAKELHRYIYDEIDIEEFERRLDAIAEADAERKAKIT